MPNVDFSYKLKTFQKTMYQMHYIQQTNFILVPKILRLQTDCSITQGKNEFAEISTSGLMIQRVICISFHSTKQLALVSAF